MSRPEGTYVPSRRDTLSRPEGTYVPSRGDTLSRPEGTLVPVKKEDSDVFMLLFLSYNIEGH